MLLRHIPLVFLMLARDLGAQCADGSPPPCAAPVSVPRTASTAPPSAMSIAVLPFENRSPDSADVYFAEGMTDEITNQLARIGKLQLRARSAVAAQWRRTPDPLEAARRLNVSWVVHGHVRHAGSQLLVNVELIRRSTGEEVWAARFPRRDTDVFAIQAEVAESVAVAIGGRLTPRERAILVQRPTRSNEAYRLYLLGNSLAVRRTPDDLRQAINAYEGAIKLDSSFAAPWARMAVAILLRQSYDDAGRSAATTAQARNAIRHAMQLDSTSSDVYLADGMLASRTTDLARARTSLERAVRLDTLNEEAVGYLGFYYLWYPVDSARAEPLIRRALALNPDRKVSWLHLHYLRWFGGHIAEASAYLDTVQALGPWQPAWQRRAVTRLCAGDGAGALAAVDEADRLGGRRTHPDRMARFRVAIGDSAPARARLAYWRVTADTALAISKIAHNSIADFAVALGLYDEAMVALERSGPDPNVFREMHSPCFAPLRKDPRFSALLARARSWVP